jgi:hypothetical protein
MAMTTQQNVPERLLDAMRILELANKAYFIYLKQPPREKAKRVQQAIQRPSRRVLRKFEATPGCEDPGTEVGAANGS